MKNTKHKATHTSTTSPESPTTTSNNRTLHAHASQYQAPTNFHFAHFMQILKRPSMAAHKAWNKVLLVIAAETVGDFHDGQIMIIRVGNRHITLQRKRLAGHILDAHPRQIRARLLHVGDLVGHHLLGLVHQRRHLATSKPIRCLAGAEPNSKDCSSEANNASTEQR